MALLKLRRGEPRDIAALGRFNPGEARFVSDDVAARLVTCDPDLWEIVVPEAERDARRKKFAGDQKPDIK